MDDALHMSSIFSVGDMTCQQTSGTPEQRSLTTIKNKVSVVLTLF